MPSSKATIVVHMNEYPNWFEQGGARKLFELFLSEFDGQPLQVLQIGAFTGDASQWLLRNLLTNPEALLVDVDTWEGSDELVHHTFTWTSVEQTYLEKLAPWAHKISPKKMTSEEFFLQNSMLFDFIYIDGDHTAASVLSDAIRGFSALKSGGILAFDDYMWGVGSMSDEQIPQKAIDAFLMAFAPHISIMHRGLQVWVRKH